ncbi:MAG TPA: hypothetical protein O0W88_01750 [Methanocorpusculum sp.]|nr:hypothetical protein [Methanocorpusculum sp.]
MYGCTAKHGKRELHALEKNCIKCRVFINETERHQALLERLRNLPKVDMYS